MEKNTISICYTITRGKQAGKVLVPHRNANGQYVVSKTRFKEDHVLLDTLPEVLQHLDKGFKLRMSEAANPIGASLINRESMVIEGV
jgi:hypothetical protein